MAYVPKDWETGEVITEEALDHIEQGIAAISGDAGIFYVTFTHVYDEEEEEDFYTTDKTFEECKEAFLSGKYLVAKCPVTDEVEGFSYTFYLPISNYGENSQDEESITFALVNAVLATEAGALAYSSFFQASIDSSGNTSFNHFEYTTFG